MKLNLGIREITVSLLHELREPIHTLFGSSEILRNKAPQEMEEPIRTLYVGSKNLKSDIEKVLRNLDQEFDVSSSSSAVFWFHKLSSLYKGDVKIISDSIKQIQTIQETGSKLATPSLTSILDNIPKALDRLDRYIEYFSTIKEEDFSVWDTQKLLRIRYGDSIPDEPKNSC